MIKSLWNTLSTNIQDLFSIIPRTTQASGTSVHVINPLTQQQVQQQITEFEQSITTGLWLNIDKQTLIADIKARVLDPFQVNQGGQPFCGPASIVFELVRTQPLRYVQICRSLFETGGFDTQTRRVESSVRLRQSYGRLQMSQADWLVMATLRDCENILFPVEPEGSEILRNLAGITKPWEMKGWCHEILGYHQVKHTITEIYGEFHALQDAAAIITGGGVVFALITAEGLLESKTSFLPYPDHWITILGDISVQVQNPSKFSQGEVSCDVYSWGKRMHVNVQQGPLENYFWGLVTGQM